MDNNENNINVAQEPWNEYTDRTCTLCGRVLPKKIEKHKWLECKHFGYVCIKEEDYKIKN